MAGSDARSIRRSQLKAAAPSKRQRGYSVLVISGRSAAFAYDLTCAIVLTTASTGVSDVFGRTRAVFLLLAVALFASVWSNSACLATSGRSWDLPSQSCSGPRLIRPHPGCSCGPHNSTSCVGLDGGRQPADIEAKGLTAPAMRSI